LTLEAGPPWSDLFTITANYAGTNNAKVTVWSNGVNVGEQIVPIVDGYALAEFPGLTAGTNDSRIFRTRN
jgi:hypothetical protein